MKSLVCGVACWLVAASVSAQNIAEGLKDAYKDYFDIGVAVNMRNISHPDQVAIIKKDFNSITAENVMKPESVQPAKGHFTWDNADRVADFCRRNGLKLRGHCLMWHNQIGRWMYQNENGELLSKEELFANMKAHITAVVSRYKDVVYCWDVVNEAISDGNGPYRNSPMYKIAGDEFIKKAFIYAREADPDAMLFYNDYNAANPGKRDRIYNMVKSMKAEGVPIDGIGMQGHYNIYGPSMEEVDAAITKYATIVDNIHITELDIRVNMEMGGQLKFKQGDKDITLEMQRRQEEQYTKFFTVLRRHKDVVKSVTFWNLSDRDSWLGARNYPLPYDENYKPKPVYDMIKNFQKPETMIKVYVMPSCPDCDQLKRQLVCDERFEVIDISSHVRRLKEFVRLRDANPAFAPIKEAGSIGIPCFLKEDGSVTFSPEEVGLNREEETVTEGAACNLDGTGC